MTDTPDDIRARGLRSIETCMERVPLPDGIKSILAKLMADAHLPFCVSLWAIAMDDGSNVATLVRKAFTIMVMVNAFNEFIRTTYPEDRWIEESSAMRDLLNQALDEGPLS